MNFTVQNQKETESLNLEIDLAHNKPRDDGTKVGGKPKSHKDPKNHPLVIFKSSSDSNGSDFRNIEPLAIDTTFVKPDMEEFESEIKELLKVPPPNHTRLEREDSSRNNESSGASEDEDPEEDYDSDTGLKKKPIYWQTSTKEYGNQFKKESIEIVTPKSRLPKKLDKFTEIPNVLDGFRMVFRLTVVSLTFVVELCVRGKSV